MSLSDLIIGDYKTPLYYSLKNIESFDGHMSAEALDKKRERLIWDHTLNWNLSENIYITNAIMGYNTIEDKLKEYVVRGKRITPGIFFISNEAKNYNNILEARFYELIGDIKPLMIKRRFSTSGLLYLFGLAATDHPLFAQGSSPNSFLKSIRDKLVYTQTKIGSTISKYLSKKISACYAKAQYIDNVIDFSRSSLVKNGSGIKRMQ